MHRHCARRVNLKKRGKGGNFEELKNKKTKSNTGVQYCSLVYAPWGYIGKLEAIRPQSGGNRRPAFGRVSKETD